MILVNGVAAAGVAASDRGLAYGDGAFRTLLLRSARPRWWADHFVKLQADCAALGIACPPEPVLAGEIARMTDGPGDGVLKIIITRGSGDRGYAPPAGGSPTRILIAGPPPSHPPEYTATGVRVHVCRTRLSFQPRLAGIKHLNRLENVLARAEWDEPEIAEGLMADEDGKIAGGTMTNLFIVESGRLVTPELSRCGVAGVTRLRVMRAARAAGMPCDEEPVSLARLLDAEEAFLVNSVIGAWRIRECAGRAWARGSHTVHVRKWIDE